MRNYRVDTVYFRTILYFSSILFPSSKKTNTSTRKNIDKAHIYREKKNKTSGRFISAYVFSMLVKKLGRFVKNNFYEAEIMTLKNFLILKNIYK